MKKIEHLSEIFNFYDTYIIDLWGVMHNGIKLNSGALEVVENLFTQNKRVVFLSNAPRPSLPPPLPTKSGNGSPDGEEQPHTQSPKNGLARIQKWRGPHTTRGQEGGRHAGKGGTMRKAVGSVMKAT